jgi:hypothetical protein
MGENPWISTAVKKNRIWSIILKIDFEKIAGRDVNNNQIYLDEVYCGINV